MVAREGRSIRRGNLPADTTSFVGRLSDVADVRRQLAEAHVLTLVGAGGCGKTRLALRVASEVASMFVDGAWLVELAGTADPELVTSVVANSFGLRQDANQPIVDILLGFLASKNLLLVLDNCEHVADACAALLESILRRSPDVRVLATSREALRIAGEVVWRVPSLAVPDPTRLPLPWFLAQIDSVRLFVARARDRTATFAVKPSNAPAIATICQRLDGIPLAIELAAALTATMSVDEIAIGLDRCLDLLVNGRRTVSRQSTLRATLDWSFTRLPPAERNLLARLAVFAGPFTMGAIGAIAGPEVATPAEVVGGVIGLVEKSLVVASVGGAETRYHLLEPIRQYALEQWVNPADLDAIRRAHAEYFVSVVEQAYGFFTSGERVPWLDRIEADQDNLRAALRWAWAEDSESDSSRSDRRAIGVRLAAAMSWYWYFRGNLTEGLDWLERAGAVEDILDPAIQARLFFGLGSMHWFRGNNVAARLWLARAEAQQRVTNDAHGLGLTLAIRGMVADPAEGVIAGEIPVREALAIAQTTGDEWVSAVAGQVLGLLALRQGDVARSTAFLQQGLAIFQRIGDDWFAAQALNSLGDLARNLGDVAGAGRWYGEGLALFRKQGQVGAIPGLLQNLGYLALRQGDSREAARLLGESIQLFRDHGDRRGIAEGLIGMAGVLGASRKPERAAWLYGLARTLLDEAGLDLWPSNLADYARNVAATRGRLGEQKFDSFWQQGSRSNLDEALALLAEVAPAEAAPESGPDKDAAMRSPELERLTAREREVVGLVARGLTNRRIAENLVITEGTAALHVKHVLAKLGLASRTQVAAWAFERGLMSASEPNNSPIR